MEDHFVAVVIGVLSSVIAAAILTLAPRRSPWRWAVFCALILSLALMGWLDQANSRRSSRAFGPTVTFAVEWPCPEEEGGDGAPESSTPAQQPDTTNRCYVVRLDKWQGTAQHTSEVSHGEAEGTVLQLSPDLLRFSKPRAFPPDSLFTTSRETSSDSADFRITDFQKLEFKRTLDDGSEVWGMTSPTGGLLEYAEPRLVRVPKGGRNFAIVRGAAETDVTSVASVKIQTTAKLNGIEVTRGISNNLEIWLLGYDGTLFRHIASKKLEKHYKTLGEEKNNFTSTVLSPFCSISDFFREVCARQDDSTGMLCERLGSTSNGWQSLSQVEGDVPGAKVTWSDSAASSSASMKFLLTHAHSASWLVVWLDTGDSRIDASRSCPISRIALLDPLSLDDTPKPDWGWPEGSEFVTDEKKKNPRIFGIDADPPRLVHKSLVKDEDRGVLRLKSRNLPLYPEGVAVDTEQGKILVSDRQGLILFDDLNVVLNLPSGERWMQSADLRDSVGHGQDLAVDPDSTGFWLAEEHYFRFISYSVFEKYTFFWRWFHAVKRYVYGTLIIALFVFIATSKKYERPVRQQ